MKDECSLVKKALGDAEVVKEVVECGRRRRGGRCASYEEEVEGDKSPPKAEPDVLPGGDKRKRLSFATLLKCGTRRREERRPSTNHFHLASRSLYPDHGICKSAHVHLLTLHFSDTSHLIGSTSTSQYIGFKTTSLRELPTYAYSNTYNQ